MPEQGTCERCGYISSQVPLNSLFFAMLIFFYDEIHGEGQQDHRDLCIKVPGWSICFQLLSTNLHHCNSIGVFVLITVELYTNNDRNIKPKKLCIQVEGPCFSLLGASMLNNRQLMAHIWGKITSICMIHHKLRILSIAFSTLIHAVSTNYLLC